MIDMLSLLGVTGPFPVMRSGGGKVVEGDKTISILTLSSETSIADQRTKRAGSQRPLGITLKSSSRVSALR